LNPTRRKSILQLPEINDGRQGLAQYQIVEKLGQGGMGVVWKARDGHLDRFVAVPRNSVIQKESGASSRKPKPLPL